MINTDGDFLHHLFANREAEKTNSKSEFFSRGGGQF